MYSIKDLRLLLVAPTTKVNHEVTKFCANSLLLGSFSNLYQLHLTRWQWQTLVPESYAGPRTFVVAGTTSVTLSIAP